jgi:hypothetical protein
MMFNMPERMASSLESARQVGLDPTAIYVKLMDNQDLRKHLADPRVLQALIDVCRWASGHLERGWGVAGHRGEKEARCGRAGQGTGESRRVREITVRMLILGCLGSYWGHGLRDEEMPCCFF